MMRFTSLADASHIFLTNMGASMFLVLTNLTTYYFVNERFNIPFSIIVIEFLVTSVAMIIMRLIAKLAFMELQNKQKEKATVIIFGAGEAGLITKNALQRDPSVYYNIIAFVDDDTNKTGKQIDGIKIYKSNELSYLLANHEVLYLILAVQQISPQRKKQIIETALEYQVKVLNVPPVNQWINGQLSFGQIRNIKIEDLLEREIIHIDEQKVKASLTNKTILITGAAGSIGSELARSVLEHRPKMLILFDNAETPLFFLELELSEKFKGQQFTIVLGDIRVEKNLQDVFQKYKPQVVFHAAAYKHVPMMERNPLEAIRTNIAGTRLLADCSLQHEVEQFVMVSTDKAVNPTNVMGASKRTAEIYVQSLHSQGKTRFITTRFGNVLGSNGSVVTLFKNQINNGGPITITHPDVTRYFMTIPEACSLVLEAGTMGKGGEIFVFDMGESVKIIELAKKMIRLSGLELGRDIQIVFTGMRPGEKLYEELLNDNEAILPTYHPKIKIGKVRSYTHDFALESIAAIEAEAQLGNTTEAIRQLKLLVPEFISQNSEFEALDNK
jgi:FlaA1/EpsC-like NDP-sugar epimerase